MRERVCLCVRADRNPYLGVLVVFMLLVMQDEKKEKMFPVGGPTWTRACSQAEGHRDIQLWQRHVTQAPPAGE